MFVKWGVLVARVFVRVLTSCVGKRGIVSENVGGMIILSVKTGDKGNSSDVSEVEAPL